MYRSGQEYQIKPGRTYFFFSQPGYPSGNFRKAIETYCNALINTGGGMLVFGVDESKRVVGFPLSRADEDSFKLNFDGPIRSMKPIIHPHEYRFDVIYLKDDISRAIFEIRFSAGQPQEIYENAKREMYVIKDEKLYGPLYPYEITQIVLEKYKEELSSLIGEHNQRPLPEEKSEKPKPEKKSRWDKKTWP